MRLLAFTTIAVVLAGDRAQAQSDENAWPFSASAYTYIVPDSRDYVQPTFTADRGWLHLEARYNYEDLDTGSAWFGYNFSGGEEFAWAFTPMLGGVFGNTTGIAPGFEGSLGWWKLELSSECEHVFDADNSAVMFSIRTKTNPSMCSRWELLFEGVRGGDASGS